MWHRDLAPGCYFKAATGLHVGYLSLQLGYLSLQLGAQRLLGAQQF